jgi:hypothetical protein
MKIVMNQEYLDPKGDTMLIQSSHLEVNKNKYLESHKKLLDDPSTSDQLLRLETIVDLWCIRDKCQAADILPMLDKENGPLSAHLVDMIRHYSSDISCNQTLRDTASDAASGGVPAAICVYFSNLVNDSASGKEVSIAEIVMLAEAVVDFSVATQNIGARTLASLTDALEGGLIHRGLLERVKSLEIVRPFCGPIYIGDEISFKLCMPRMGLDAAISMCDLANKLSNQSEELELLCSGDVIGYVSRVDIRTMKHIKYAFEWRGVRVDFEASSEEFKHLQSWSVNKVADAIKSSLRYAIQAESSGFERKPNSMNTIDTSKVEVDTVANAELAPPKGQRRIDWWSFMPLLIFICFAYGVVVIVDHYWRKLDAEYAEQVVAVTKGIPVLVERIRHVEPSFQDMQPAVVWSGEGAKILLTEKQTLHRVFSGDSTSWTVLGRTPKGRFFSASYELYRGQECEEILKCVPLHSFRGLTEKEARRKVFNAGKRDLYRELFGEDMPPTEVNA